MNEEEIINNVLLGIDVPTAIAASMEDKPPKPSKPTRYISPLLIVLFIIILYSLLK